MSFLKPNPKIPGGGGAAPGGSWTEKAPDMISNIGRIGGGIINALMPESGIGDRVNRFGESASGMWNTGREGISRIGGSIRDRDWGGAANGIGDLIGQIGSGIGNMGSIVGGKPGGWMERIGGGAGRIAPSIGQGAERIINAGQGIYNQFAGLAHPAVQGAFDIPLGSENTPFGQERRRRGLAGITKMPLSKISELLNMPRGGGGSGGIRSFLTTNVM